MRDAVIRVWLPREEGVRLTACAAHGCDNLAMGQKYCGRCAEELEAQKRESFEREAREIHRMLRRMEWRARFAAWGAALETPALVLFVLLSCAYLAFQFGLAFFQ